MDKDRSIVQNLERTVPKTPERNLPADRPENEASTPDRQTRTVREPTAEDIRELLAFLPQLHADGFTPVKCWHTEDENGTEIMPDPEYDRIVEDFMQVAARFCRKGREHGFERKPRPVENEEEIAGACLQQIQILLERVVRGERFCTGAWYLAIKGGHVRRILERLSEIERELGGPEGELSDGAGS